MGKGRAVAIELDDVVRRELTALTRKHGAPQALAERARIVLAAAGGLKNKEIASKLGICTHTVGTWRNRFAERGMDGLYDEPRPGTPREIGDDESRARSAKRWRRDQRVAHTGASGAWLKRSVMRLRRCIASGAPLVCTPPRRDFQALHRSAVRRESTRYRRALLVATRTRNRVVCR